MLLKQQLDAVEKLRECNKTGRKIYIRGTGNGAAIIYNELKNLAITVDGFVDISGLPKTYFGYKVLSTESAYLFPRPFIICSQMDVHTYFMVRDELESHGLVEREDFYSFGNLGFSFLRQPEKQIVKAPNLIQNLSIDEQKELNFQQIVNYFNYKVHKFLPQIGFDYRSEDVFFPHLNIITNISCSMKCKYCFAGSQVCEPLAFEPKGSINDFDKILGVSKVLCVKFVGGEIFCHKNIADYFRLFANMKNLKNVECVEVFANCTIIPTDDELRAFNEIGIPKYFVLSNYPQCAEKKLQLIEKLEKFNIQYDVFPDAKQHTWYNIGDVKGRDFEMIGYTDDELKLIKQKCQYMYGGLSYMDGKLYICASNLYVLYDKLKDYVDIRNCTQENIKQKLYEYLYLTDTYDLCAYCKGVYKDCELVSVAEQL